MRAGIRMHALDEFITNYIITRSLVLSQSRALSLSLSFSLSHTHKLTRRRVHRHTLTLMQNDEEH